MNKVVATLRSLSLLIVVSLCFNTALGTTGNDRGRRTHSYKEPPLGAPQEKLPSVCYGDVQKYGIKGENGTAMFFWSAYTFLSNGSRLDVDPTSIVNLSSKGDSVKITWKDRDNAKVGGIYTLEVVQKSSCGFDAPYRIDIVVNTSDMLKRKELVEYCDNIDTCVIDFSKLPTFKDYTRLYVHPSTTPLDSPIYKVTDSATRSVKFYTPDYACAYAGVKPTPIPSPKFSLGKDTTIREEDELYIDIYDRTFTKYVWYTDNPTASWWPYVSPYTSNILVRGYDGNQFVSVTVTNEKGCIASDSIQITTLVSSLLRIPAAFTPNGDGINDTWEIAVDPNIRNPTTIPEVVEVRIYDRWGSLVWYKEGTYIPWDGRDLYGRVLPVDSYHYEVNYFEDRAQKTARGSVTIIR